MADSAIGDLDAALSIGSDDLFLMEQNGNAKKVPGSLLTSFIDRNVVTVSVSYVSAASSGSASYNSSTGALSLAIPKGAGVSSVSLVSTSGLTDTYKMSLENGDYELFEIKNGSNINYISCTSTGGGANHNVDTYTVFLTNGSTTTFNVTNGIDGTGTVNKVAGVSAVSGNVPASSLADALLSEFRIKATDIGVSSISWVSDSTYTNYPYRMGVSVSGMTSNHYAEVVFDPEDAADFAPVCQTSASTVLLWCMNNTRSTISIPTIFAWR